MSKFLKDLLSQNVNISKFSNVNAFLNLPNNMINIYKIVYCVKKIVWFLKRHKFEQVSEE